MATSLKFGAKFSFLLEFDDENIKNAASTTLKKVLLYRGQKIIFTYDFGDS